METIWLGIVRDLTLIDLIFIISTRSSATTFTHTRESWERARQLATDIFILINN